MAGTLERGHTHSNLLNKKIKIEVDEIICTLPNRKFQKGITLVALVLTIIVIMILTMVSINIIINKEIVNKAQVATDKYQESDILEKINLAIMENKTEGDKTLLNNLQEIKNAEVEIKNTDAFYVTINEYSVTVYEDESIYLGKVQFWNGSISTEFFHGTGTEEDPYIIKNCEDMAYLANEVNSGNNFEGKFFKLISNLDFGARNYGSKLNVPYIGMNSNTPFSGIFDGDNKHIRGILINQNLLSNTNKGLFGYNKGKLKNIVISGESYIASGQFANVGLITGYNEGVVSNCKNFSNLTVTYGAYSQIGVLVGKNDNEITNCYNIGNIKSNSNISGVLGINSKNASIKKCYNLGQITGSRITGVAYENYGEVTNCYNKGNMNSTKESSGIVNCNRETGIIINCYNTGNARNGGICKYNSGIISKSFNTGNISCKGGTYIGGIVGINKKLVIYCYNIGNVEAGWQVGGIVGLGDSNSQVKNCYNIGIIKGSSHRNAITGNGPAGINCYYLDTATKDSNSSVKSKTREELQSEEILTLLNDGENVWIHDYNINNGFPIIIN